MLDHKIFKIEIAELVVEVKSKFEFCKRKCSDYIVSDDNLPDIIATASEDEISKEKSQLSLDASDGYCEDICLYRSIAEQLPSLDRAVFHGAAVEAGGKGYIFTAPSGTGKTTHIRLWLEFFSDKVKIINGDKPILKLDGNSVSICSTPWAGKEGMQRNTIAPVGAICIIRQAKVNRIKRISPSESFGEIVKQIYLPRNAVSRIKTLDIVDRVLKNVPIYLLECDISREAAELSFNTLTKE